MVFSGHSYGLSLQRAHILNGHLSVWEMSLFQQTCSVHTGSCGFLVSYFPLFADREHPFSRWQQLYYMALEKVLFLIPALNLQGWFWCCIFPVHPFPPNLTKCTSLVLQYFWERYPETLIAPNAYTIFAIILTPALNTILQLSQPFCFTLLT